MMQEQLRKFGRFGLILATILIPIVTKDAGNSLNVDEITNKGNTNTTFQSLFVSDNSRSKFEKRLRDVIIDMVRLEYI